MAASFDDPLYPDGVKHHRMGAITSNMGKADRSGYLGYKDYIEDFYYDYPGGADAVISQAKENRKTLGEFNSKSDKALAPRLDDWTLNRKNPAYEYNKGFGTRKGVGRIGGMAQPNSFVDNRGKKFSPVFTFDQTPAINPNNRAAWHSAHHPMSEEMVHGAQDTGENSQYYDVEGYFGDEGRSEKEIGMNTLPYAAVNHEMGAKLTNMKQDYIKRNWRAGKRKTQFNRGDAGAIIDKYNRGVIQDPGLKKLHWSQGGKDYLKDDQKYFEDFLMSTAMNDKPGNFTGTNRKFS